MRRLSLIASLIIFAQTVYATVPTCSDVKFAPDRPAWLSVPNSRIVLNPNMPQMLPASWAMSTSLPVHAAYFIGERPVKLPGLWSWMHDPLVAPGGLPTTGPKLTFTEADASMWQKESIETEFNGDALKLTVETGYSYGAVTREMTVDLDSSPRLSMAVKDVDGGWCIKVNSGKDPEDIVVMEGRGPGGFAIDLPDHTGWHGSKAFKLRLFVTGGPGATATFTDVRFVENRLLEGALISGGTTWYPHQIVSTGKLDPGNSVEAATCFVDESTIAQRITVKQWREGSGRLTVVGRMHGANARWDDVRNAALIQSANYHIAIAASKGKWLGTFPSLWDASRRNAVPGAKSDLWAMAFDDVKAGDEIVIVARFGASNFGAEKSAIEAKKLATPEAFAAALKAREDAWNGFFAKIPHPADFKLHRIKRTTVIPDDIRLSYYRAWTFLLSNVIPPMPENGFRYPQVGCGKPSLWDAGHPSASNSAQWESIIAMQFLAWAEPELAWNAYEGMLSLVDMEGSMGGECLPAHHANTAWVLYSLTGDKARLERCYPAMKRWLLWKAENPRWIIGEHDPGPQAKSAEFVSHALMDMAFARRIAGALGMKAEQTLWDKQITKLAKDYRTWFWEKPGGTAYFAYDTSTGKRTGPGEMWALQALALPLDILGEPQRDSLLKQFRANWFEEKPFILWNSSRYPNYMFAVQGVWRYGTPIEAARMCEAVVSAVADAGEFGEVYSDSYPINVRGVWPSVFGAENAIDGQLRRSGVAVTDGLPVLMRLPDSAGVENLRWKDGILNVKYSGEDGVELSGTALEALKMPEGFKMLKIADTEVWAGTLAVGKQLTLEAR